MVDDSEIGYYQRHSTVFTVLSGPGMSAPGVPVASSFVLADASGLLSAAYMAEYGAMASAYIDFNAAGEAAMSVTIGGVIYLEADAAVPATGVWTNGAAAASAATSLIAAINGDTRATVPFTAVADVSGDGVWLFWDAVGTAGNVTISTSSASNCTVQNSTGGLAAASHDTINIKHTVNTQELLSGAIEIPVPFTPTGFHVTATSATGAKIAFTDLVTIQATPDRIRIDTDGATNLANTNIIYLTAFN